MYVAKVKDTVSTSCTFTSSRSENVLIIVPSHHVQEVTTLQHFLVGIELPRLKMHIMVNILPSLEF